MQEDRSARLGRALKSGVAGSFRQPHTSTVHRRRYWLWESDPVLASSSTEYHLLNSHVHPDLRIVEVLEAILWILGPAVPNERFDALKALAPGGKEFGRCAAEPSVQLLVAVRQADITILGVANGMTRRCALDYDEFARANP